VNDTLVELPLPDWAKKIAVFDLETTGLDVTKERVITACVTLLDENGNFTPGDGEWLLNPGVPISPESEKIHGISNTKASTEGMDAAEGLAQIIDRLNSFQDAGIPISPFNGSYDFSLLYFEAKRYGLEPFIPRLVLDAAVLDAGLDKREGPRNLESMAAYYNVELVNAHNATADAVAGGRVAQAIARKYSAAFTPELERIFYVQTVWANFQNVARKLHFGGPLVYGWPLQISDPVKPWPVPVESQIDATEADVTNIYLVRDAKKLWFDKRKDVFRLIKHP
jgi:DNA polymerase-3 subunit epsilon